MKNEEEASPDFFIRNSKFEIRNSPALLIIAIVALLLFAKPLVHGEVPNFRDHFDYFQPLRWYTANELRHARLPLWNPYNASGEPWLANPQTCVFYPPAWLFLALPFATAYTLFLALHVMLAGWGAFLLFNRFASARAALAAALALMLSGPLMSLADINNNLATFAWIPLVLWCAVARVGPQKSALAIAMSFLAGEPFFAALGALAFALIRRRDALNVALTAISLCAIELFPFVEALRGSDRTSGIPPAQLLRESMPLRDWLGVVWPFAAPPAQHFIPVVYVGLLTMLFALLGSIRRGALRLVCFSVIAVCVVVAAGAHLPLSAVLLTRLPVAIFRYPARVVPVAALAICALAAVGLDRFVRPRWTLAVAALMCADALLRTMPLLASAPFDPRAVPYDRSIGRDAKLVRIGFENEKRFDRRAWIAGYLNLYDRRFDAWTAAPFSTAAYTVMYETAMARPSLRELDEMSCGYMLTEQKGRVIVLRNRAALPMAYLRADDGRIAAATFVAFTGTAIYAGTNAPVDATLVVTQQPAPGWRATIDGRATQTFPFGVFRAVRVPRGRHDVAWRYRPLSLMIGAIVTLLALLRVLFSMIFVKGRAHQFFFAHHSKLRGKFDRRGSMIPPLASSVQRQIDGQYR